MTLLAVLGSAPCSFGQPPSAWGDGSAGALTISSPTDWVANPAPANLQFTDITITSVLTIPGGMTLRATGQIQISQSGAIVVMPPAVNSPLSYQGIASTIAYRDIAGEPVARSAVYSLLRPPAIAGGSGAGWESPTKPELYFRGGSGGGSLVLRAAGNVTCYGTILAKGGDGTNGGAGGGGGVIVIASKGTIGGKPQYKAPGGAGSTGFVDEGGINGATTFYGRGGGGGVIVLVGPTASTMGIGAPPGGAPGPNGFGANSRYVGGGASGGKGGNGQAAAASGFVFAIQVADPSHLFL